jgi:hypothetical protein
MSIEPSPSDEDEFDEPARRSSRAKPGFVLALFVLFFGSLVAGLVVGDVFENYQNSTNL